MAVQIAFPGIYIIEDTSLSVSISGRSTAIPVFVGVFAPRVGVPVMECVRIENWMDFIEKFYPQALVARFTDDAPLEVTGTKSRKKKSTATQEQSEPVATVSETTFKEVGLALGSFSLRHYFENGGGTCYVLSLAEANYEVNVAKLAPAIAKVPDITLLVYCEYLQAERDLQVYTALNTLLRDNQGFFLLADSPGGATISGLESTQAAAYYPAFETNYKRQSIIKNDDLDLSATEVLLKGYDDYPTLSRLKAALDADVNDKLEEEQKLYDDLVIQVEALLNSASSIYLRASPAMAGLYAVTDRTRGVWKAPANIAVAGVKSLVEIDGISETPTPAYMTPAKLADVHAAGVNAIRSFFGKGVVVWGARTLKGTEQNSDPNWIYVPVRRLFNSVERDVKAALGRVMFEPNHSATWETVRSAIDNYLFDLWKEGALQGVKPQEAYFVQVGLGVTMTKQDIDEGNLIVEIGLAAVRPVEFVILRFTQNIEEAGSKALAAVSNYV